MPFLFTHHRQTLDVAEVARGELGVLPHRARRPAVEIVHPDQHADFAVLFYQPLHDGNELFIFLFDKFSREPDFHLLAILDFIEFNRHIFVVLRFWVI